MEAIIEKTGDVTLVTFHGERLDVSTAKEFKDYVAATIDPAAKNVFDLSHMRFVDSTGLGAVVAFLKQSKSVGGELKLCGMSRSIRKLFELVRVHKIVDILEDKEEAINAFEA